MHKLYSISHSISFISARVLPH